MYTYIKLCYVTKLSNLKLKNQWGALSLERYSNITRQCFTYGPLVQHIVSYLQQLYVNTLYIMKTVVFVAKAPPK